MRVAMTTVGFAVAIAVCGPVSLLAQTVIPSGWRWHTDAPASIRAEQSATDSSWRFVTMAPGWHITTRPAATMYDPAIETAGNFAVESVQVLFPGTSQSGYGVFLGGRGFDTPAARYVAFLARRDGAIAIEQRSGTAVTPLVPWTPNPAVKLATGNGTVSNTLRVTVQPDSVRFTVNGEPAATLARGALLLDGHFGFRTGDNLNLHVTSLDLLRRLAPVPSPAKP